jgi:hypothetical protein
MSLIEDDVRVALGDLLKSKWQSPAGYALDDDSASKSIGLHLRGSVRTDRPLPQLTLVDVSNVGSFFGTAGDGTGPVIRFDGRVDVRAFVGSAEDVPGGEAPALLARAIAREATEIVKATPEGLSDPATGEALAYRLEVRDGPTSRPDPEAPDEHRGDVEVGYKQLETTPQR